MFTEKGLSKLFFFFFLYPNTNPCNMRTYINITDVKAARFSLLRENTIHCIILYFPSL